MSEVTHSYWLLKILHRTVGHSWIGLSLLTVAAFLVFPLLALVCALIDGTLSLHTQTGGTGLLEHYGYWAQFVSCPVLVVLAFVLLKRTLRVLGRPLNPHPDAEPGTVRDGTLSGETQRELLDLLGCKGAAHKSLFVLMITIGLFALIVNIQNTRTPESIYGADVWDSSQHMFGYISGRLFLGFEWLYVFPLIGYISLACWIAVQKVVRNVVQAGNLKFHPFATDKCGGFRPLGEAMSVLAYIAFPFAVIIVAHVYTHPLFYPTLWFGTVLFAVALIAILFLPFWQLHIAVRQSKRALSARIGHLIDSRVDLILGTHGEDTESLQAESAMIIAASSVLSRSEATSTWPFLPSDIPRLLLPILPSLVASLIKLAFK
jgi:hypothetical protein